MTIYRCWQDLPYREIWVVDTEFCPGAGTRNGGKHGDPITPYSLVAYEMRSRRIVRLLQHELGPTPPYGLGSDTLVVGFFLTAEFGFHLAKGWGQPANALDLYIEHRHITNNGALKAEDLDKGFYSLAGAARYYGQDTIDTTHKQEMRERIIEGPPFSDNEARTNIEYNEDDTRWTAKLLEHMTPMIRSLEHALFRAKVAWAVACEERRGVPLDMPCVIRIRTHWGDIALDLVRTMDRPFGIYEIEDGVAHWREERFKAYLRRHGMGWPTYDNGTLDQRDQTFREMEGKYPQIGPLRELRFSLSKLRLNNLQVGNDGRNRVLLGPYGSKGGSNQPSNSKYIFGPAKWIRHLITPPPGRALVHRDYCQQEIRIAAILSGDKALLAACEAGDVYRNIAAQLGFMRDGMSELEVAHVRALFKTVVLGISYGLGARSLAIRIGLSLYEAAEILARLRARFHVFEDFCRAVSDRAGLDLEISTPLGWIMQCPPGINPRTVRNFPMQSTAAEILHVFCVLAERRGIEVCAPIHDAFLCESALADIEDASIAVDRCMRDASALVLRGYELPTDQQIIRPGQRYEDKRGREMWDTVTGLVAKLEAKTA